MPRHVHVNQANYFLVKLLKGESVVVRSFPVAKLLSELLRGKVYRSAYVGSATNGIVFQIDKWSQQGNEPITDLQEFAKNMQAYDRSIQPSNSVRSSTSGFSFANYIGDFDLRIRV